MIIIHSEHLNKNYYIKEHIAINSPQNTPSHFKNTRSVIFQCVFLLQSVIENTVNDGTACHPVKSQASKNIMMCPYPLHSLTLASEDLRLSPKVKMTMTGECLNLFRTLAWPQCK